MYVEKIAESLKKWLIPAGIIAAGYSLPFLYHMYRKHRLQSKIKQSYQNLDKYLATSGEEVYISPTDKQKAFSILATVAPRLAANPAIAANFVKKYAIFGTVDMHELHTLASVNEVLETIGSIYDTESITRPSMEMFKYFKND